MKNNDWHEAYYDLVNKVECECVQQGDLVPIWDQFKAMSAELAKFKALAETLAGALEKLHEAYCADDYGTSEGRAFGRAALIETREALREYKEATNV